MKIKVTIQSALLGVAVFIVFVFQSFERVTTGKWSETVGVVMALVGAAIGLAIAVTAISPAKSIPASSDRNDTSTPVADKPPRQFRNVLLQWLGFVIVFLLMFRLLDAFHIDWRRFLH
jgi:hypothetical protein